MLEKYSLVKNPQTRMNTGFLEIRLPNCTAVFKTRALNRSAIHPHINDLPVTSACCGEETKKIL